MENRTATNPEDAAHEAVMKYVMGEMDPAEAFEFRQRMESDQDLLIEVESLKRTLQKVQTLPLISAPDHVLRAVTAKAFEKAPSFSRWYFAAAAALVFLLGSAVVFNSGLFSSEPVKTQPVVQQNEQPNTVQPESDNAPDAAWKDRKRVVTIDQVAGSLTDSAAMHPKLKPVSAPSASAASSSNVTLTRSKN